MAVKTLILTQKDVQTLLTMERAVAAVERAFAAHGNGETIMPPKVYLSLEKYDGDFRAMPAYLDGSAGVKWVNAHPHNPQRHGLPTVRGVYILSDPATASPLAIMDATLLTAYRTGAAGAVASKYLGQKSPRTLGLIGCGVQARVLLSAHRAVFSGLEVKVADLKSEAAEELARQSGGAAVSIAEAAGCDLVCTATPSRTPVVQRSWVRRGTHVNAMGADAPGKQELDPQLIGDSKLVVDDWEQATEGGEVNVPIRTGQYRKEQIFATLGEIVAGKKRGRQSDEISVFDSTGLAIQDVALARFVYDEAMRRNLGLPVELVS
jgi:alanine dehydrogenase